MAIAIYQDLQGRQYWAEPSSPHTLRNLSKGTWVLVDDTPETPPPPGDPLDNEMAERVPGNGAFAGALRAASVAAVAEDIADRATPLGATAAAAFDARYLRKPTNTLGRLGDSITAQSYYEATTPFPPAKVISNRGYGAWGLSALGQRLQVTHEAGIGGQTTADVLARVPAYLAAGVPAWTDLEAGTNDVAASLPAESIIANLDQILDLLLAAGSRVILRTLPPLNSAVDGKKTILVVNNWIRRQALTREGILLVDWTGVISQADGNWIPAYTSDGIHPNPVGAVVMGNFWASKVAPFIPAVDVLPQYNGDPTNFVTNAVSVGTAGAIGSSAATSGTTGQVADDWRFDQISGTTIATLSKVARSDGLPGAWQQCRLEATSSANAVGRLTFRSPAMGVANVHGLSYAAGDQVYGLAELQVDTDIVSAVGKYLRVTLAAVDNSFVDQIFAKALDVDPANTLPAGADLPRSLVLVTPIITIPAAATKFLELRVDQSAKGTIRLGRAGLWKVGSGPLYGDGFVRYYAQA